jgi:hypothetical protein
MSMTNSNEAIRNQIDSIRKDGNIMGFERWRAIGALVVTDLKKHGHFFNTEQGLFFFDAEQLRSLQVRHDEPGLAAILNRRYGINPKEHGFGRVVADLVSEAYLNGRKIEIRRLAHYDREKKWLYVSRLDGHMYRLDGESITELKNGTDDVFFFDDPISQEPYRYATDIAPGELDRQLIDSVNFADGRLSKDEQRKLLKLWLMAVFFGSIQPTKIILLLLGEHGSGKTSALRRIQKFIFGPKADLLAIEKDKQDGFVATVTTDPLALFDNLDERVSWLPYALSRLATGVTFAKRVLYTTNQKANFPGVSWLGITARSVDFMANQPDLPDRTLVLETERLNDKQPEGELVSAVSQNRNAMWSELLDTLNEIVRQLRKDAKPIPVKFRMADFASFALQVATVWGCRAEVEAIFAKLEQAQTDLVFEEDPIPQVLSLWLKEPANHGRKVDAGSLFREWGVIARKNQIGWPFADGRGLARRLGQLRHALSQYFTLGTEKDPHLKQNLYRFWPKGADVENPVASGATVEISVTISAEAGTAGYAG